MAVAAPRGAFVDNRGVRWDPNDADFEGWLTKKSKWLGEWRKRYFILKGSKLFFAKGTTAPPHGIIDLVDCVYVKASEIKAKRRNAFEIKLTHDSFLMFAETEADRDNWITHIGKAVVKHSSLHVQDDEDDDSDEGS